MQNYGTKLSCGKSKVSYFENLHVRKKQKYKELYCELNLISVQSDGKFHIGGFFVEVMQKSAQIVAARRLIELLPYRPTEIIVTAIAGDDAEFFPRQTAYYGGHVA